MKEMSDLFCSKAAVGGNYNLTRDILLICADGLTGIKEAIAAAFPKTEYQRCIVHQVRNTLKYVPDKDRKAFATDLKTIYQAADEQKALAALEHVTEKWTPRYPNSMKRWKDNWDAISPIFKFSATVRKVIYTTNAIESLNSTYRKLNRQRSVFPSDTALLKALYLATFEATKKWTTADGPAPSIPVDELALLVQQSFGVFV